MSAAVLSSGASIQGTLPLEVVVYCACGDESRDEKHTRVYVVAAVFGHEDEWKAIAGPWKARLNGKVFHSAECESGYGEFEGLERAERLGLYRDLTQLVAHSRLLGHSVAINVAEYKAAFPDDFEDAPYLWAFGEVIHSIAELASVAIPPEKLKEVTFHQNPEIEHNASILYEFVRRTKNQSLYLADRLSFAPRDYLGVQVADLVAREAMKRMDQTITGVPAYVRASFNALNDTQRFAYIPLGRKQFMDKKAQLAQLQVPNSDLESYRQWLRDNRLQDCLTNRIEHMKNVTRAWDQSRKS